jgi:hypothetical protein
MKRNVFLFTLSVVFLSSVVSGLADTSQGSKLTLVSQYGTGKLFKSGPLNILQLNGNYRQMGKQYGWLLKEELNRLYEVAVNGLFIGKKGYTYERLKEIAGPIFDAYPQRFKEIIYGMAETSGLGIEKQVLLTATELYPRFRASSSYCSGMAVWGDYTSGGPLVFGRNNDDAELFKELAGFLVVAVFNPSDFSIPIAIINYAGVIYAPSGMNREGIFLEINSGNYLGYYPDRLSIVVTLFSFLQDFATMEELGRAIKSTRVDQSSIINVADGSGAYSYECSPRDDVKQRLPDRDGLLASTNHFIESSWGLPPPDDAKEAWTLTRRNNLLDQGEKNKGAFDVEKMKEVFGAPIFGENRGVFMPSMTIYQIIAVPAELKLWVKVPDFFDWQEVDLKKLFKRK